MNRRDFVLASAAVPLAASQAARAQAAALAPIDMLRTELSLAGIALGFAKGRFSAVDLTRTYLGRIDRQNTRGPNLRAVIETNPRALEIAAALDDEYRAGKARGPLHGVPVLVKDNIETADPMMTTAGSLALEGWYAPQDAPLIARLRAAGAVILGKTNMS
jgi:amidase